MTALIRAVIDLHALRSNFARLRALAPQARMVAVVKANAYGHGLAPVARALAAADTFAVARIDEGIALRAAGIRQPILLLEGVFSAAELAEAVRHEFDLVIHGELQVELVEKMPTAQRLVLWLKIDTGMHRLGFDRKGFAQALARLQALPAPQLRLMTHLACADERGNAATAQQLERFKEVTGGLAYPASIGNSAGILGWPEARREWLRPGIALYGVAPFVNEQAASLGLAAVMTLQTSVIAVHRLERGASVGYGAAWRAPRDSTIAILAGGYGDGYLRSCAVGTPVLINAQRAALVGRVSMDMIAVDVSAIADVQVGTRAVLWGQGLPVEEVAASAATIAYELLCGVSARVPREYLAADQASKKPILTPAS